MKRLCAVCHLPAHFALVDTLLASHISGYEQTPDGFVPVTPVVTRFTVKKSKFYCRKHIAAAEREGK